MYEADQAGGADRVAVKLLHSHLLEAGGVGPRAFRREAIAAREIRGDHVVRVLDAGTCEDTGHLYLVTERLEGEDLQRRIDRDGPLSVPAAVRIAAQVLAGLSGAHAKRIVHRDVKPANIFLARGAGGAITAKILDFGIAKMRPDSLASPLSTGSLSAFATTTGGILGSPLYMAPEQVQGSPDIDPRADLWATGAVLYAALAGRAPQQHLSSMGQLLVAICTAKAPPLGEVAPWVPREVVDVVDRALQIHREARHASAAEMLASLRRIEPGSALTEDLLAPTSASARPPPRLAVAGSDGAVRGDEATELRSAVPSSGLRPGARFVTVDPRRILGDRSELWTFSLDVHKDVGSLVSRVYRSLRRAGAPVQPRSYGLTWTLFDPGLDRAISDAPREDGSRPTPAEAGIRSGAVLWVMAPGPANPDQSGGGAGT